MASCATFIASIISASETSFISPSTIATLSADAPTIKSISASSICSGEGFTINSPFNRITLTSDIGPLNGISEIAIAVEAASAAKLSGETSGSWEFNDIIICTSAW